MTAQLKTCVRVRHLIQVGTHTVGKLFDVLQLDILGASAGTHTSRRNDSSPS